MFVAMTPATLVAAQALIAVMVAALTTPPAAVAVEAHPGRNIRPRPDGPRFAVLRVMTMATSSGSPVPALVPGDAAPVELNSTPVVLRTSRMVTPVNVVTGIMKAAIELQSAPLIIP